jgi:hypothetical protein
MESFDEERHHEKEKTGSLLFVHCIALFRSIQFNMQHMFTGTTELQSIELLRQDSAWRRHSWGRGYKFRTAEEKRWKITTQITWRRSNEPGYDWSYLNPRIGACTVFHFCSWSQPWILSFSHLTTEW